MTTLLLFGLILIIIAASIIITDRQVERAREKEKIADGIAQGAIELGYLSNDYLIYRQGRHLKRWQDKFTSFSAQVADLQADNPEHQALVRAIKTNQLRLKEEFDNMGFSPGKASSNLGAAFDPTFLRASWSRLEFQNQRLASDASRLSQLVHEQMDRMINTRARLMYLMVGLFGLFLFVSYRLTYRRILRSIATLQAGTAVIGSGNLGFFIEEKRNDEIGDLSRAFNRMTRDLKTVTASKADLEKEIVERQRAEAALRESQQRMSRAEEIAGLGSWELDLVNNRLSWSDEVYRIFGLHPQEFAATYEAFLETVHPDDRQAVDEAYSGSLREGRDTYEIEHRVVRRSNGEVRTIQEKCRHIRDEAGEIIRSVGMILDITERKQADEAMRRSVRRLDLLARTAGDLLQTADPQRVVESLCRKVMEYLDCQAFINFLVEESAGRLHLNAWAGIPREEAEKIEWLDFGVAVCGCAARDGCRIVAEHIPTTPDIRTELVKSFGIKAYACHPLYGAGGKVMGTLSFGTRSRETFSQEDLSLMEAVTGQVASAIERMRLIRELQHLTGSLERQVQERTAELLRANESLSVEIAQRRQAEESLNLYTRRLEVSNRDLQDFAFVASHDLQEPLRKIQSFGNRLTAKYGPALGNVGRDYLERMGSAAQRMQSLIQALLDFSRVTTKSEPFSPVDLTPLLKEVTADLETRLEQTGGRVELGDLPTLQADPHQIRRLFLNLIGNALKFHREEKPVIKIYGAPLADSLTKEYRIFVEDNGIGFDEKYLDRIFTPFQRLHGRGIYEGTGMGLAICRKIVERHGGTITAQSHPGEGSTFIVTLPWSGPKEEKVDKKYRGIDHYPDGR